MITVKRESRAQILRRIRKRGRYSEAARFFDVEQHDQAIADTVVRCRRAAEKAGRR